MARKIPSSLSPEAQAVAHHLRGWREFNDADAHQVHRLAKINSLFNKALARKRAQIHALPHEQRTGTHQKKYETQLRNLKDKRRKAFERLINVKGDAEDPLSIGQGRIRLAKKDPHTHISRGFLLSAHTEKLSALKKQKKPRLP